MNLHLRGKLDFAFSQKILYFDAKRPTVGFFNINVSYLNRDMDTPNWHKWIDTVIHVKFEFYNSIFHLIMHVGNDACHGFC